METQTTLSFPVRKNPCTTEDFYGKKASKLTIQTSPEKLVLPKPVNDKPVVKKIFELDSDDENIDLSNIVASRRKGCKRKRSTVKSQKEYSDDSDSDCSPVKRPKTKKRQEYDDSNTTSSALYETAPLVLPGREKELEELKQFLNGHLENESSGTMYISGPPGTGKTVCLTNILQQSEFKRGFVEVYINCTTMKTPGSIYNRICQELHVKSKGCSEKAYLAAIDKHLSRRHDMILLVLDEIDQLRNKNQSVLYTIFEWPSRLNSKLVLIGIANALDLTDRILPRLQARCELRPKLMHFAPYTKQQIIDIFMERLGRDMKTDLFSPAAIQLLAAKVAAISGDVRRALDIGRRVIDLASPKTHTPKPESSNVNIEIKQVMSVLNDVYGASQRLEADVDDKFPLQQKILICSLLLILTKGRNKDVTIGRLHDVYTKVCKKRNIAVVDSGEFFSICELVETRGIVRLIGKKEARTRKIVMHWDEAEVKSALSDKRLISDIINDVSCL